MSVPADSLPGMRVQLTGADPGSLEEMIGTECFEAALGYIRRKAVIEQVWVGARNALFGVVRGRHGECYAPSVFFSGQAPTLEIRGVRCSCDAGYGCEHAAALLIAAVEGGAAGQVQARPAWDASLESWLADGHEAGQAGETTLAVTPVIRVDGLDQVAPVLFIGAEGHGVVYLDRAEAQPSADPAGWRFRLARLGRAVPAQLQEMALTGRRIEVPAGGQERFRDRFYPRLRQMATVISSDGSFVPPVISDPTLVLRASYGDGHHVEVDWEWAYQVGDARFRAALRPAPGDTGYRDLAAEQKVLDGLPAGGAPGDRGLDPGSRLAGLDTVRFTTELLPLLSGQPGVTVEVTGEAADYRDAGDSLRIGVSAGEVAGDNDWFDLGVTITVEGREVPFADVFTALSLGESHLLLPDGAYFSLDKPELRQLASLIKEARALQDPAVDSLRISRFQAGLWEELAALGVVGHQAWPAAVPAWPRSSRAPMSWSPRTPCCGWTSPRTRRWSGPA